MEERPVQTSLNHLQVNVNPANTSFYKDLLTFVGWRVLYEGEGMLGMGASNAASLWFVPQAKDGNDYDGPGVNHIAIGAEAQADVDTVAEYLTKIGVKHLFETPRHRPEFSGAADQTYYQLMFESPDRVLFEVVYTGVKS
jgi:hypothetical protein